MEKCMFSALWIESMNVLDLASSYKTPQSVLSTIKEMQKLYINDVCFSVLVKKEKSHSTGLFVCFGISWRGAGICKCRTFLESPRFPGT